MGHCYDGCSIHVERAQQLPGDIPRKPKQDSRITISISLLCQDCETHPRLSASSTLRGASQFGWHAQYLWVTWDTQLTWSNHINQVRRKATQIFCVLGPILSMRSGLSIRDGVLLYKQIICTVMDYACLIWRSVACTHLRKLLAQSRDFRIITSTPWYISNMPIHEDFEVLFFGDHIRALRVLTQNLAGAWNPLVQQLGRYLAWQSDLKA